MFAAAHSIALGTLILVAGPPMPDRSVDKMCAASSTLSGVGDTTASCKRDERDARESLMKTWDGVPEKTRAMCLTSIDSVAPSFVALKSCVDNAVDAKPAP